MRFGLDARLTHYAGGGISVYIRRLAAELPALSPDDEFLIFHSRKARERLPGPPNARRVNCWTPAHHRWEAWALGLEVAPHRPALLHSPDFIPPAIGRWRAVITVHDLTFLRYPQFLTPESRRYYNRQIDRAVRRADAIAADSHATAEDLWNLLSVPEHKVTVIHLAQDDAFGPLPREAVETMLKPFALSPGYILFVGTFEPRKNVPNLLRAYAALRADLSDAPPLLLVGRPGWLFDEALRLMGELKLRDHVRLLAGFPQPAMPALYNGAGLLALPSHYEGFGLPVLEALACGTPAVISDRASLPEIAGGAALEVDPDSTDSIAEGMRRALTDSALRDSLRVKGLARAAQFSWKHTAAQTLELYRRVSSQSSVVSRQ